MCETHDHDHAQGHVHEHGHCGHCNHDELTLEELKSRRAQLDRDIAAREALATSGDHRVQPVR